MAARAIVPEDPFVRIRGRVVGRLVEVHILSVRVRAGATITVTCSGSSCPRRSLVVRVGRHKGAVRLKALERPLRVGTVLHITVTMPGRIGKFTRLTLRGAGAPRRDDLCLRPGASRPVRCPTV